MVSGIKKCVDNANKKKAMTSGISQKQLSEQYMLTKNGFEGYDEHASFSHSMTMKREGVETKVSGSVQDYNNFSMKNMIDQLNEQFDSLQEPKKLEKVRIPVIMRPQALLQWIGYLGWTLQQREADDGINPYSGQLGKQFFGEKFSLYSSVNNPLVSAPLFHRNGLPAKNTDWIKNGVIKNMQRDRYYARQKKIEPAMMFNTIIDGGNTTEKEMMKMVKRGVILNNLWYIRPVDAKSGEWTGLTRDGVLYFEDGEIKHSVTNFRWNEILHDATKRIIALGQAVQVEHYAVLPTIMFDDFNFVDVTTF
jgi:predicted Zn-dependent protease